MRALMGLCIPGFIGVLAYDNGSKVAPNQRELTGASQPLPTKDK